MQSHHKSNTAIRHPQQLSVTWPSLLGHAQIWCLVKPPSYLNSPRPPVSFIPSTCSCLYLLPPVCNSPLPSLLFVISSLKFSLTLILLTWRIWRAPANASKWRMGFKQKVNIAANCYNYIRYNSMNALSGHCHHYSYCGL